MNKMQNVETIGVASADSQGSVHIGRDAVYRIVRAGHEDAVHDVLKALGSGLFDGVIETEVCTDAVLAASLGILPPGLLLKHRKIERISYAHEWCGAMLKDAALFHLKLSEKLVSCRLFLKDAHPWNILFEKGAPVLVDFTSIVTKEALFRESFLEANRVHGDDPADMRMAMLFKEIFERMYVPYFAHPLCGFVHGRRSRIRKAIENATLNASTSVITLKNSLPELRGGGIPRGVAAPFRTLSLLRSWLKIENILKRVGKDFDLAGFHRNMRQFIAGLKVEIGSTAYSRYYQLKGEDSAWDRREGWNDKQKSVYEAVNRSDIETVLDVACNTGWYAVMAAKLGKRVVAFDIDEGCIETLYNQVRTEKLDILPLVLNLTDMTPDRYSIVDGKRVLINAVDRLRSDSVIALGIVHHLALGVGLSFDQILDKIVPLCSKQLVIEFIDRSDRVIRDEPVFFPAYFSNRELLEKYDVERLVSLLDRRGFDVIRKKSHPSTRSILVCARRSAG